MYVTNRRCERVSRETGTRCRCSRAVEGRIPRELTLAGGIVAFLSGVALALALALAAPRGATLERTFGGGGGGGGGGRL